MFEIENIVAAQLLRVYCKHWKLTVTEETFRLEDNNLIYEAKIARFVRSNGQLKDLNIDSSVLQLNRIVVTFVDGLYNLQELRIHNASMPFFLGQHCRNLKKLRNISRLENYDSDQKITKMKTMLNEFMSALSSVETLKHLTIKLKKNDFYDFDALPKCTQLKSLAISPQPLASAFIFRIELFG